MINIFDKKYVDLFYPYHNEILWEIADEIGYNNDYTNPNAKKETLNVLKQMLDLDIINILCWVTKPELENKNLTNKEIIKEIDKMWVKETDYPDFYSIVIFGLPKWYKEGLEALGLSEMPTKDELSWEYFVEYKIGNLEGWIEKNRPKNI